MCLKDNLGQETKTVGRQKNLTLVHRVRPNLEDLVIDEIGTAEHTPANIQRDGPGWTEETMQVTGQRFCFD